jgi:hypothetical protein
MKMTTKNLKSLDYDEEKDQLEEKQEEPDLDKNKTINQVFETLLVKVVE